MERALESLKVVLPEGGVEETLRLVRGYVSDARFYLEKGDCETSIACSSYAEGLLDALRFLGRVTFEWPSAPSRRKRVLVGGVFDLLHPGHIYFLRRASELGNVYVVVARDKTVIDTKGRQPLFSEEERLEMLKALKFVSDAFLGDYPPNFANALRRVKPDIVFLGADQGGLLPIVEKAVQEAGLNVEIKVLDKRLNDYSSTKYKSLLL